MPINKGKNFEEVQKEFLRCLINELFDEPDNFMWMCEPKRQFAGTQYGRDITAEWRYKNIEYRWWFECKDYKKGKYKYIPKSSYTDKILEVLLRKYPTCFCLVGTHLGPCNWANEIIISLNQQKYKKPHFLFWPIEEDGGLKSALKCYQELFEKIYPRENFYPKGKKREEILKKVKDFIMINNEKGIKSLKEFPLVTKEIKNIDNQLKNL